MTHSSGWSRVPLRELIAEGPANGYSPPSSGDALGSLTLRLSATTSGRLILNERTTKRIHEIIDPGSRYWLRPGDVLIQRANTLQYVGTTALYDGPSSTYIYPDLMMRIRPNEKVDASYLTAILNSPSCRKQMQAKATGTAGNMPKVNGETVRSIMIDLPPLQQQIQIARRLEGLQLGSRRARAALVAVSPLIERLRQSILAAAFRGDLTSDWRAANAGSTVHPNDILADVRAQRRRKWEERKLANPSQIGKKPPNANLGRKYIEPTPADGSELPSLPPGWAWATVDELTLSVRNGITTKPDQEVGLRILRISSVRPLHVDLNDVRFLPTDEDLQDYRLHEGDVLITRYNGNPELVGAAGIVRGLSEPTVYPDKLIKATTDDAIVSADYLCLALNAAVTRRYIAARRKTSAGQVGVSGGDVKQAPVPLPPPGEQRALVRRVLAALEAAKTIGTRVVDASETLARLDAICVARAFAGSWLAEETSGIDENIVTAHGTA